MKNFISRYKVLLFLVIALLSSWSIWIPMALGRLGIIEFNVPIIIGQSIGGIAPLIVLILLDKITKGGYGIKQIFDSIRIKGKNIIWLIPAALILPLTTISGSLLNYWVINEGELRILAIAPLNTLGFWLIAIIPLTFFAGLLSSPILEEPCWRGFALGHLQNKFGKHIGSLILGSFWWLWHQPINIANGLEVNFYSYLIMLSHSFLFDSIYNLSSKNLLSAMFAHSSAIITYNYIYQSQNIYVLLIFLIAIIVLRTFEWKRNKLNLEIIPIRDEISFQPNKK